MLTNKKNNNEGSLLHEKRYLTVSSRKIALHIVAYMTVLYFFNSRTNGESMSVAPFRRIPLFANVFGSHHPLIAY